MAFFSGIFFAFWQLLSIMRSMTGTTSIIMNYFWVIQSFIIILFTMIAVYVERVMYRRLLPKSKKRSKVWDKALIEAVHLPLLSFIWLIGLSFALESGGKYIDHPLLDSLPQFLRDMGTAFLFIWFLVRFIREVENALMDLESSHSKMDKTSVQAICQILRLSVLITGALVLLRAFGVPLSGVVAFAGAGGLSVGFAAKDLVANFFGGLIIFLDRPFKIGDWIRSPDREIEGTVEKIGWRLTRIRTFDKRPLFIPNGIFSNISIENASRMRNRRIKTNIGVRYKDADKIHTIVNQVEEMLKAHPDIDWTQASFVNLVQFGSHSLEFMIYAFTKTTAWIPFQKIQEEIYLKTIDIILKNGAECALPASTIYIPNPVETKRTVS